MEGQEEGRSATQILKWQAEIMESYAGVDPDFDDVHGLTFRQVCDPIPYGVFVSGPGNVTRGHLKACQWRRKHVAEAARRLAVTAGLLRIEAADEATALRLWIQAMEGRYALLRGRFDAAILLGFHDLKCRCCVPYDPGRMPYYWNTRALIPWWERKRRIVEAAKEARRASRKTGRG